MCSRGPSTTTLNGAAKAKKVGVPMVPDLLPPGTGNTSTTSLTAAPTAAFAAKNGHDAPRNTNESLNGMSTRPTISPPRPPLLSPSRLCGVAAASDLPHRNSTGSNSSQTSSGFESMKSSEATMRARHARHAGHSPPSRASVHSSGSGSSSLGSSIERLDDSQLPSSSSSFVSASSPIAQVNVAELIIKGVPEAEILALWLQELRMNEYLSLFLTQGYDLASIARITPEDLTTLGVSNPSDRKRLITEIHRWRLGDAWPVSFPSGGLREWLTLIGLPEYMGMFESQGYCDLQEVLKLTWEDLEDIGIKRLGHLKRLGLAIKKMKDHGHELANGHNARQSNGVNGSGEVRAIRVSAGGGRCTVAEVKPYAAIGRRPPPPPPAPPSSFLHTTDSRDAFMTYPRRPHNELAHNDQRPTVQVRPTMAPPRLCTSHEAVDKETNDMFNKCMPIRLNLHSPGRILSERISGLDSNTDTEDYPPPPAPIACEGSIRRLRSVISVTPSNSSSESVSSNRSSNEALPFANEDCGTIRSRMMMDMPRRGLVQHVFTATNNPRKGDVLNDIGCMLQNLTDELDAMLCPVEQR